MSEPIVIVGASTAGLSAARELRACGEDGVIQLVDRETVGPYRRPAVSKGVLAGHQQPNDVAVAWPEALELERLPGLQVTGLDLTRRRISSIDQDGSRLELPFSRAVIATGSAARPLRAPGPSEGLLTLRNLDDALAGRERLRSADTVLVIGAGFIGLEVAAVARSLGKTVVVLEAAPLPLAHAVGEALGSFLAGVHRDHGVRLICRAVVAEMLGSSSVQGVRLDSGEAIEADLVVAAVGSAPETAWLEGSGLDVSSGVQCDSTCVASAGLVAAGDVASWINPLYGARMRIEHWSHAIEQGTYAGRALLGRADPAGFATAPYFWSDQYDLKVQSVGVSSGHDEVRTIRHDEGSIVLAYGRNGILIAVAGVNAGPILPRYRPLINDRASLDSLTGSDARLVSHG